MTDYEKNKKRNDENINYRVYEDSMGVTVSPTTKARLNITIHPYLKDEFKKLCEGSTSVAEEVEKFIRSKVEEQLKKPLIMR